MEIDDQGRIFSGHNGGDTRGFHYVQGGYSQKGFGKHGPLSNPYALGYFPPMPHRSVPRFTHTLVVYGGDLLPPAYRGQLFAVAPLLSHVVVSRRVPVGSSFRTEDTGFAVKSTDPWFRPVDIKHGPDGGLYIADWYDAQVNHYKNHEGQIDPSTGRVYRLRRRDQAAGGSVDLSGQSTEQLLELLAHPNRWHRRTALRLLAQRHDRSALPRLVELVKEGPPQAALEALWAVYQLGGLEESLAAELTAHGDPFVRLWSVRLMADGPGVSPALAARWAELARSEQNVEVRNQLACSARRLPAEWALPIVRQLLTHEADRTDPQIPLLLWWALESQVGPATPRVLELVADRELWSLPLFQEHLAARLMRRYAQTGRKDDRLVCARLLGLAPDDAARRLLLAGFEEAMQGRAVGPLPDELVAALEAAGGLPFSLRVRRQQPEAVAEALAQIADRGGDRQHRLEFVRIFGEVPVPPAVAVLLDRISAKEDPPVLDAALAALGLYDQAEIAQRALAALPTLSPAAQDSVCELLATRAGWSLALVAAVEAGRYPAERIPAAARHKMRLHRDEALQAKLASVWGDVTSAESAIGPAGAQASPETSARLLSVVQGGQGDPYRGRPLFEQQCARCHTLFGKGGQTGPDLTSYQRTELAILVQSVVQPSAEIREGFEQQLVLTSDGRILSGLLVGQDDATVSLLTSEGQTMVLLRDQIDEMSVQRQSLMPEGLLASWDDQQIRDLFAFLRSSQPLSE